MPFLRQGASASVTIPAGQSIRLGALRGSQAQLLIPNGMPGGPVSVVTDGQTVFGPYPNGAVVQASSILGDAEYVVGASPVLTDQPYLPGSVVINGGTINNTAVGPTTPSTGRFTSLRSTSLLSALTDSSGTPGDVTNNAARGRAAFAAAASTVVVTSSLCAADSSVFVSLGGADATLTSIRVTPGAGSFTVRGNAAATGITPFDFLVVQN